MWRGIRHLRLGGVSVWARCALALSLAVLAACGQRAPTFEERFRPAYHFTPARNWMNDPNGLVYHNGVYHLFFQHNPRGDRWGNLSWGHAVSRDLVNWRELGVAMPERDVMIFSGSAVIDAANTSGFSSSNAPAMVAFYTGHDPRDGAESQYLAYSLDEGRTWAQYDGNPIIERPGIGQFRDPKVFWHAATQRWVMVLVHPGEQRIAIYTSDNMRAWREASVFGPGGLTGGPWETPDLFELPIEGGGSRWVLSVGVTGQAGLSAGSGVQYFVGTFDGERFIADDGAPVGVVRWVDYGSDFYAPQTWSGIPAEDGRRIWIAWMANTRHAEDVPTSPWRGMMTIPRELRLEERGGRYELVQAPVRELESLRRDVVVQEATRIAGGESALTAVTALGGAMELDVALRPANTGETGLVFAYGAETRLRIGYDARIGHVFVDRSEGGAFDRDSFRRRHYAPVPLEGGVARLRIFLDHSSVEVFADDGARVISDAIFPDGGLRSVSLYATGAGGELVSLSAWRMAAMERD